MASRKRRKLREVWIGSQSFQYDAANDRYPDTGLKVVDIRADQDVRIRGNSLENAVFIPAGPTKVGMSDFLVAKSSRESGLAGVLYTSGLAK